MPRRAKPKREPKKECDCPRGNLELWTTDYAGRDMAFCRTHEVWRKFGKEERERHGSDTHSMDR